jgi:hypothetical protein
MLTSLPCRVFRDAIAQIVGTDIGYYQIGSQQVPALMIVPPEPQATWRPQGLEIVIDRNAVASDHGYHGGLRRVYSWQLVLNQWDRSELNRLMVVRDRILTEFASLASYTHQPQTDSAYERCNMLIQVQKYIKR